MISTGSKHPNPSSSLQQPPLPPICQPHLSQHHQPLPTHPSDEKRKNQKNKFINKLKQLNGEGTQQMQTLHPTLPSQSGDWPQGVDRRERNKMAARQSRNRKKLYVKLMQSKIENLEMEMIQTVEEIEQLRLEVFNAEMHQVVQGKEAKHKQLHIIKKLEKLLNSHQHEERNNEINICLDSLIFRIGAVGSERKAALKKLYSDLLNFSQPALYRYMLWSAIKKISIFGQSPNVQNVQQDKLWSQIDSVAAAVLQTPGAKEKLDAIAGEMGELCTHFQKSAQDLVRFRGQIEKKGQVLQEVCNDIRQMLQPEQNAQLILFVMRNQFKRDLRLFEEEDIDRPSKKVKIQDHSV